MMELRIRKSALRMAKILYYCGFVLMVIALPVTLLAVSHAGPGALITEAWLAKRFFAVFVPGYAMVMVGRIREVNIYSCPNFGALLTDFRRSPPVLPQSCESCGVRIFVVLDDKKH